ncbi:hypothetical protein ACI65C_013523 [Semiaphis heraclei]
MEVMNVDHVRVDVVRDNDDFVGVFDISPLYVVEEIHFEKSQFELHRQDGIVKLKPNAIPTLFDVPNPPARLDTNRKSVYKKTVKKTSTISSSTIITSLSQPDACVNITHNSANTAMETTNISTTTTMSSSQSDDCVNITDNSVNDEIARLQMENTNLKNIIEEKDATLRSFLNDDQVAATKKTPREWSKETIIKGLKLRFALGVHGYKYLRDTNYPIPAYSTLTKRLREFKLKFGIFHDVLELLKHKVQSMDSNDRFCVMSVDEMEVSKELSYDKNSTETFGFITLGNDNMLGGKLLLVIIRGLKNKWKQVIGCHLTDSSLDNQSFKQFIQQCIESVESCGIHVLTLSSDMGNTNRALWSSLDVKVKKDGIRKNTFDFNSHNIFIMPDICHLLKNLKSSLLKNDIILPKEYCENEGLSSQVVKGSFVVSLWEYEINSNKELRSLHHLKREDMWPSNFEKMHVGAAIRFFSLKTAAAIELAVKLNVLPSDAITTAHFIRLIQEWFSLTTSKVRKTSITKRNKEKKYDFLLKIITITENTVFGHGWKPLNAGIIMATLSIIGICETLFNNGFDFVLCHRLTQDAIENIFSQIRRKAGATPTAFQCLQALKLISTSQFLSDVDRSNYCNDNDIFLIDFF